MSDTQRFAFIRLPTLVLAVALTSSIAAASKAPQERPISSSLSATEALRDLCSVGWTLDSMDQFDAFMVGESGHSGLLQGLSEAGRRRFKAAVVYRGDRAIGIDTADLEAELPLSRACRVLGLFGLQELVVGMPGSRIRSREDRLVDVLREAIRRDS